METNEIVRSISFSAPNRIGLEADKWSPRGEPRIVWHIVFYGIALGIAFIICMLLFIPISFESVMSAMVGAVLLMTLGLCASNALAEKIDKKKQKYRADHLPALSSLLAEHGLLIPEQEQRSLEVVAKWGLRVETKDGIRYQTNYLDITDKTISAEFYLWDKEVAKSLKMDSREKRISSIVSNYEAQHGEFSTPELRAAFHEGVRQAYGKG